MKLNFTILLRGAIILAGLALISFGGYQLLQRKQQALSAAPKYGRQPTPVHVVKAETGALRETRSYLAVCEPVQQTRISARITATINKIPCDEGTMVKAGQILLRLDDREILQDTARVKDEIEQVQADLAGNESIVESLKQSVAYWQREADRDQKLADRGDIPGSQAEGSAEKANEYQGRLFATQQKSHALQHQIDGLKRRQQQLEVQLSYCTIRSPYDGLVTRRLVDPGDLAAPAKALLTVEDRSQLKLSFDVPQQDLSELREGLALIFAVNGQSRHARITHLYPSLNADRLLRAESMLENDQAEGLVCGSYVPVSVVIRELQDAVLVPASSLIVGPKGKLHVFVVRGGKLEHPEITVLGRGGDKAAITGIKAGEAVVASTFLGWANLAGGMEVEPVQ